MSIARAYRRFLERLKEPRVRFGLRRRLLRYARIAAGFVLTLAFLAAVGAVVVAVQSRVRLDAADSVLEIEPQGSLALQASERIFGLRRRDGPDQALSPGGRRMREHETYAGAESGAAAFLMELRTRDEEGHPALSAVQDAIAAREPIGDIADAVSHFSAAVREESVTLDWSEAARRRLFYLAATRLDSHVGTLTDFVRQGRDGPIAADAERAFFRAKGEAYGWALILRGASQDWGAAPPAPVLEALDRASLYQPLFLFNGPSDSWIVPNHLAVLAVELAAGADALIALVNP